MSSSYSTVFKSYKTNEDEFENEEKIVLEIDSEESFKRILEIYPIVVVDVKKV